MGRTANRSRLQLLVAIFSEQNHKISPVCNCNEKDKITNSYKRFPEDGLINLMIASAEMHAIIIDVGPEKRGKEVH